MAEKSPLAPLLQRGGIPGRHGQSEKDQAKPIPSTRGLVAVWAALLALLGLTIAVARLHFIRGSVIVNLLIATAKAALVLLFFMQLR
jgi:hypothetical protein